MNWNASQNTASYQAYLLISYITQNKDKYFYFAHNISLYKSEMITRKTSATLLWFILEVERKNTDKFCLS